MAGSEVDATSQIFRARANPLESPTIVDIHASSRPLALIFGEEFQTKCHEASHIPQG